MREIKYRAWLKNQKIIVDVQELHFYNNTMAHILDNYIDGEQEWIDEDFDDYELMQYTGLNDKNGVEIYEGDIVLDRWANAYTPVFQNGIYMAYNPKNLMQNDPSTQFNIIWKDGCEIIGNIYEHSYLLE